MNEPCETHIQKERKEESNREKSNLTEDIKTYFPENFFVCQASWFPKITALANSRFATLRTSSMFSSPKSPKQNRGKEKSKIKINRNLHKKRKITSHVGAETRGKSSFTQTWLNFSF